MASVPEPEHPGQLDAGGAHTNLLQEGVEPRRVRALGQPKAARPVAEAAPMRANAGLHLNRRPGVGGQERQDGVGRRGRPRRVGPERGEQSRAKLRQLAGRRCVLGGRALGLSGQALLTAVAKRLRVAAMRFGPDLAQETQAARHGSGRLELIAQHRRQRERDRRPPQNIQQRQIARGDRLPQPFLTERPSAKSLHVGHVRVQHESEFPGSGWASAHASPMLRSIEGRGQSGRRHSTEAR